MNVTNGFVIAASCVILIGTATAQSPNTEKASVGAATERFLRAFENLDWEAFRLVWASEPTVFFPFDDTAERVTGKAAMEARWQRFFRERLSAGGSPPYLRLTPRELLVKQYGDAAIVTFHLRMEGRPLGRRTLVFVKENGEWKIAHLHASPANVR
jgi:ketosteroid isomerase-like protein